MNKQAKNLTEFKALIERYETIKLDEIRKAFEREYDTIFNSVPKYLTGYSGYDTCSLCKAVGKRYDNNECFDGVYGSSLACTEHVTYSKIEDADTLQKLLSAYRAGEKYLRSLLEETK